MTNKLHIARILFLLAAICCLAACSTAKLSGSEEDQRLRTMKPAPGMALIYVVRPLAGGAIVRMRVDCDGTSIGSTNGKRYIYAHVKPGKHDFVSKAENKDELSLVAAADSTYFIEQIPEMGFFIARNSLKRLSDAEGRKKLSKCKLSGDCPAYLPQ